MELPYFTVLISLRVGLGKVPEYSFHSSFRGIYGRILRDTFCIQRRLTCPGCPMQMCLYRKIFEEEGQGFERYHPYIIRHVSTLGDTILIEHTILGSLTDYASSILHSLLRLEELPLKIGDCLYPITIVSISDSDNKTLYSLGRATTNEPSVKTLRFAPEHMPELVLHFITPLRMKNDGRLMSSFVWKAFLRSLHHRIQYLNTHFNAPHPGLPELWPDESEVHSVMQWQEMYRKSYRQQQKMSLGGLIGTVHISNPHPETLALLKMGQVTHAGKQTTFGLGKYMIRKPHIKEVL